MNGSNQTDRLEAWSLHCMNPFSAELATFRIESDRHDPALPIRLSLDRQSRLLIRFNSAILRDNGSGKEPPMNLRQMISLAFCLALTLAMFARAGEAKTPQHSDTTPIQQELINTQKAYLDALERGDAQYVKGAVADDFVFIETNGDSTGKIELVRGVHPPEHPEPSPILYDFNVVQLDDGCAIVSYRAVYPGNHTEKYQHLSDTWVKQGGQWKLKFQQTTLNLWSSHDLD
jgi:hypothetical protein